MSIYFIHFFNVFLPVIFLIALTSAKIKDINKIIISIFLAFLFGYFAFFIAANSLQSTQLYYFTNILSLICFLALFTLCFFDKPFLIARLFFIIFLSFNTAIRYFYKSQDYPLFISSLLDTQAVLSSSFILLAFILLTLIFIFLRWQFTLNKKLSLVLLFLLILGEFDKILADILLIAMRENIILTDEFTLSFVAKSQVLADMMPYFYLFFVLILSFASLKLKINNIKKKHLFDIEFRKNEAKNSTINAYFSTSFISLVIAFCMGLHFDLVSSKPMQIDPPKEVLPNENGLFVFDVELLRDNNLHRFAFVSNEGKVIRFFLLNKREDRDSPVAVFDACMLCGDMGYIKRNGELICIACNVRIFLLSVGKEGGCNPIPLPYEFDGEKITIKLEDVIVGTNYFTEIKEVMVQDVVSKTKILNTKAEFSYLYKGLTYYFATKESYEAFKNDPESYVEDNLSAKFRTQGYEEGVNALGDD